jgi:hypothetical protein
MTTIYRVLMTTIYRVLTAYLRLRRDFYRWRLNRARARS